MQMVAMIYLLVPSSREIRQHHLNQQQPLRTKNGDHSFTHQSSSIQKKEKEEKTNTTTMPFSSSYSYSHNQNEQSTSSSDTVNDRSNYYDVEATSKKKRRQAGDSSEILANSKPNDEHHHRASHHHLPPNSSSSSSTLPPSSLPPLHESTLQHRNVAAIATSTYDYDDDNNDECKGNNSSVGGLWRESNPGASLTSPSERTALISGSRCSDDRQGGEGGRTIKGMQGKLRNVFSLREILRLGRYKFVRRLLLAKLGIMFPSALFMSMFAQFCVTEFRFEPKRTGRLLSYVPLVRMIGQGLLVNPLVKLFSETLMIRASCFVVALSMLFIGYATTETELYLVLLPLNLSGAVAIVVISGMLTQAVPEADTGGVLGLDHAVLSFAYIIGPLASGWIYELYGFVILGYLGAFIAAFTGK